MSYIALYRKWRPLIFEDVVEQEHVVKTLKNSVTSDRIGHAYLFCGTRGTGKTTMAKIFSRAINCVNTKDGNPCNECEVCKGILSQSILDVVEIDAASNNSVDNVRDIRDGVIYAPTQTKYKVYIIDEVHMLSSGAFNALLKTLEEPPKHVVFILATTEPHKLPATILSRCQRFDFRRIPIESIMGRLEKIVQASDLSIQKEAARLIARLADGALRDAISILDQCISLGNTEISYKDVLAVAGIVKDTFIAGMVDAVGAGNVQGLLQLVDELVMEGKDIAQFVSDLIYYYRNTLICKISEKPEEVIDANDETLETMKVQSQVYSREEIMYILKELSVLESSLKWATHPRILLEVWLVRLSERNFHMDKESIADRLSMLESKVNNARFTAGPPANAVQAEAASYAVQQKPVMAEEKPKPKVKKAPEITVESGKPLENWEKVLNELKSSGRMVLYSNLLDTKAVMLDEKLVGIIFGSGSGNGIKKMIVSKAENTEVVALAVGKLLGREVRIKCVDEGSAMPSTAVDSPEKKEKDEFMETAQDLAKRLNTPLNIIDE